MKNWTCKACGESNSAARLSCSKCLKTPKHASQSSGKTIPRKKRSDIQDAMRLAKRPCPVCGETWRRVKAYPCGKRALGTPILCYRKSSHKLTPETKKLMPRAKEDIAHQHKQLTDLGINPSGVTYDKR